MTSLVGFIRLIIHVKKCRRREGNPELKMKCDSELKRDLKRDSAID